MPGTRPIVFYDGDCGLCNRFVQFMLEHDGAGIFHYAALQGTTAAAAIPAVTARAAESVILLDDAGVHDRSDAVLRIAARLGRGWALLGWLRMVPRPIRDRVYDWVARNRYGWFGYATVCRLPEPASRRRFLP